MICPSSDLLPPAPFEKSGWPWTQEIKSTCQRTKGASPWPTISIITPNLNQGDFLEGAIRSVISQGYPNLEYIVMDGGSTDRSIGIIRKYEQWITYWESKRDKGQSHAINKGLTRCRGEIINWLNADDMLAEGALFELGMKWARKNPDLLAGTCITIDNRCGWKTRSWPAKVGCKPRDYLPNRWGVETVMSQPSTFLARSLIEKVGEFREDLHYVMDWEFYLRAVTKLGPDFLAETLPSVLSTAFIHPQSKTGRSWNPCVIEQHEIIREYAPRLRGIDGLRFNLWMDRVDTMKFVTEARSEQTNALKRLLLLSLRKPSVMSHRFYWGALRREFIRGLDG